MPRGPLLLEVTAPWEVVSELQAVLGVCLLSERVETRDPGLSDDVRKETARNGSWKLASQPACTGPPLSPFPQISN